MDAEQGHSLPAWMRVALLNSKATVGVVVTEGELSQEA